MEGSWKWTELEAPSSKSYRVVEKDTSFLKLFSKLDLALERTRKWTKLGVLHTYGNMNHTSNWFGCRLNHHIHTLNCSLSPSSQLISKSMNMWIENSIPLLSGKPSNLAPTFTRKTSLTTCTSTVGWCLEKTATATSQLSEFLSGQGRNILVMNWKGDRSGIS